MKGSIHTQVYKIQSIIFIALIIFGLKISLIKRRKKWIDKPLEDVKLLMTMIVLEKNYKFKTNLLLPIKLTIFPNFDELGTWVLYIGT